ncbi:hypothetical protein AAGX57_14325, partial [Staphylococcus aureus]
MEISKYQEIATRTHNDELNLNESIGCYEWEDIAHYFGTSKT